MRRHLAARWRSVGFALAGLRLLVRREANARVHAATTILVAAAGLACRLPAAEWRWLVAAAALVWAAEGFNTALELLADRICAEQDPAIAAAKDVAAGAVLVAALAATAIGALTFLPHLPELHP